MSKKAVQISPPMFRSNNPHSVFTNKLNLELITFSFFSEKSTSIHYLRAPPLHGYIYDYLENLDHFGCLYTPIAWHQYLALTSHLEPVIKIGSHVSVCLGSTIRESPTTTLLGTTVGCFVRYILQQISAVETPLCFLYFFNIAATRSALI